MRLFPTVLLQLVGKEGEGHGEVLVFDEDGWGDVEEGEGEVPDGLNATFHHVVAHALRLVGGDGDDADTNSCPLHIAFHLVHGENVFPLHLKTRQMRIFVKPHGDVHAEGVELFVGKDKSTQGANTDQYGLVGVVIPKVFFKFLQKRVHLETHPWAARNAAQTGKVFAHQHRIEVQALRYPGRRDILRPLLLKAAQISIVQRHPTQRRLHNNH